MDANPQCWPSALATLRELGVDAFADGFQDMAYPQCGDARTKHGESADFIIVRGNRLSDSSLKIFLKDVPAKDPDRADRLVIESLFTAANNVSPGQANDIWSLKDLGNPTLPDLKAVFSDHLFLCGNHPEDLPRQVPTLENDLSSRVTVLSQSVSAFGWKSLSALPHTPDGKVSAFDPGSFEQFRTSVLLPQTGPYGDGLWLSTDPLSTWNPSLKDSALVDATVFSGNKILDMSGPNTKLPPSADKALSQAGCHLPSNSAFIDLFKPMAGASCRKLAVDTALALGVKAIVFDDPSSHSAIAGCGSQAKPKLVLQTDDIYDQVVNNYANPYLKTFFPSSVSTDDRSQDWSIYTQSKAAINALAQSSGQKNLPWSEIAPASPSELKSWLQVNMPSCQSP